MGHGVGGQRSGHACDVDSSQHMTIVLSPAVARGAQASQVQVRWTPEDRGQP